MEPRLMLTVAPVKLYTAGDHGAQQTAVASSTSSLLSSLVNAGNAVNAAVSAKTSSSTDPNFNAQAPILGKSLNNIFNDPSIAAVLTPLGNFFDGAYSAAATAYFAGTTTPDSNGLAMALNTVAQTMGGTVVDDSTSADLKLDFDFSKSITTEQLPLSLGGAAQELSLGVTPTTNLTVAINRTVDFSIDVNLSTHAASLDLGGTGTINSITGLANGITEGAEVLNTSNNPLSFPIQVGILGMEQTVTNGGASAQEGAEVTGGTMSLDLSTQIDFGNTANTASPDVFTTAQLTAHDLLASADMPTAPTQVTLAGDSSYTTTSLAAALNTAFSTAGISGITASANGSNKINFTESDPTQNFSVDNLGGGNTDFLTRFGLTTSTNSSNGTVTSGTLNLSDFSQATVFLVTLDPVHVPTYDRIAMNQFSATLPVSIVNTQYLSGSVVDPDYIGGLSGVSGQITLSDANLLDGHVPVVGVDPTLQLFSRLTPSEILTQLNDATEWATLYSTSGIYSTAFPIASEVNTLVSTSAPSSALNGITTTGDYTGATSFDISVNGGGLVHVALASDATRTTLAELVTALNNVLNTAVTGKVQVMQVNVNGIDQLEFFAVSSSSVFALVDFNDPNDLASVAQTTGILSLGMPDNNPLTDTPFPLLDENLQDAYDFGDAWQAALGNQLSYIQNVLTGTVVPSTTLNGTTTGGDYAGATSFEIEVNDGNVQTIKIASSAGRTLSGLISALNSALTSALGGTTVQARAISVNSTQQQIELYAADSTNLFAVVNYNLPADLSGVNQTQGILDLGLPSVNQLTLQAATTLAGTGAAQFQISGVVLTSGTLNPASFTTDTTFQVTINPDVNGNANSTSVLVTLPGIATTGYGSLAQLAAGLQLAFIQAGVYNSISQEGISAAANVNGSSTIQFYGVGSTTSITLANSSGNTNFSTRFGITSGSVSTAPYLTFVTNTINSVGVPVPTTTTVYFNGDNTNGLIGNATKTVSDLVLAMESAMQAGTTPLLSADSSEGIDVQPVLDSSGNPTSQLVFFARNPGTTANSGDISSFEITGGTPSFLQQLGLTTTLSATPVLSTPLSAFGLAGSTAQTYPGFSSIQNFAAAIYLAGSQPNGIALEQSGVFPTFENDSTAAGESFYFPLQFTYTAADQTGVALNLDGTYGDLNDLTTTGTATVHRVMTSNVTFGLKLNPETESTYVANQPAIASLPINASDWDGVLSSDGRLSIALDDGVYTDLTITAASTANNLTPDDFLNNNLLPAIAASSLAGKITATILTDPTSGYSTLIIQTIPSATTSRELLVKVDTELSSDLVTPNAAISALGLASGVTTSTTGLVTGPITNFTPTNNIFFTFNLPAPDGSEAVVELTPIDTFGVTTLQGLVDAINLAIVSNPALIAYDTYGAPYAKVLASIDATDNGSNPTAGDLGKIDFNFNSNLPTPFAANSVLTVTVPATYAVPQDNGFANVDLNFPGLTVGQSGSVDLMVGSGMITDLTLSTPAVFDISVAGSPYVTVSVPPQTFTDISGLIGAINTAFAATTIQLPVITGSGYAALPLSDFLVAGLTQGDQAFSIRLLTPALNGAVVTSFRLAADPNVTNNSAVTTLGFSTQESMLDPMQTESFLKDVTLSGYATATASGFTTTGDLGFLGITSSSDTLHVEADTYVRIQAGLPGGSSTTRVTLDQLLNDVISTPYDTDAIAGLQTNSGTSSITLTLNNLQFQPDASTGIAIPGLVLPANASATISFGTISDINRLAAATVAYANTNGLQELGTMSFQDIFSALRASGDFLSDYMNTPGGDFQQNFLFLNQTSLIDMFDFGADFHALLDQSLVTPPANLQQLIGSLDTSMGLPAGALAISFTTAYSGSTLTTATFNLSLDYSTDLQDFSISKALFVDLQTLGSRSTTSSAQISLYLAGLSAVTPTDSSDSQLNVDVTGVGKLQLNLGINLVQNSVELAKPTPFIKNTTTYQELVNLAGSNLSGTIPVAGVSLNVSNGVAAVNADGETAGTDSYGIDSVYNTDQMNGETTIAIDQSATIATDSNLSAVYVNSSTNGIGSTLTASANQALNTLAPQGVTNFAVGDLILVNGQTNAAQNGLYAVTQLGSSTSKWILTRVQLSSSNNTSPTMVDEVRALAQLDVSITSGTYAGSSYGDSAAVSAIGTSALQFSQTVLGVRVATTVPLTATYINSTQAGDVGSLLVSTTQTSFNSLGLEGITNYAVGDLILVNNQDTPAQNGVYKILQLGTAPDANGNNGTPWTLTRVQLSPSSISSPTMAQEAAALNTLRFHVNQGVYAGDNFQLNSTVVNIGTDVSNFARQIDPASYTVTLPSNQNLPLEVTVATTAALAATYANGPTNNSVGSTLTATTHGSINAITSTGTGGTQVVGIDGFNMLEVGDLVLVQNQPGQVGSTPSTEYQNGVYEVTSVGSADSSATSTDGSAWILTRVSWADSASELSGLRLSVLAGNTNGGERFIQTGTATGTGITSGQSFSFSSAPATVYAGWAVTTVVGQALTSLPITITYIDSDGNSQVLNNFPPLTIAISNNSNGSGRSGLDLYTDANTATPVNFTSLPDWGDSIPASSPLQLLQDPTTVGDELDLAFFNLQLAVDEAVGNEFPLVGGSMANYTTFIEDFRGALTNAVRADIDSDKLTPMTELRQAIFSVLGNANQGSFGYLTDISQITFTIYKGTTVVPWSFGGDTVDLDTGGVIDSNTSYVIKGGKKMEYLPPGSTTIQVSFNLSRALDYDPVVIPTIDLDAPGLGFDISTQTGTGATTGGVLFESSFNMPVTFGFDLTDGFYLQGPANNAPAIAIQVQAELTGDATNKVNGVLTATDFAQSTNFDTWNTFAASVADAMDTPGGLPSGFYGEFDFTFNPGSGTQGRVVLSDLQNRVPLGDVSTINADTGILDYTLNADADIHLFFDAINSTTPDIQGEIFLDARYGTGASTLTYPVPTGVDFATATSSDTITSTQLGISGSVYDLPVWRYDRALVGNGAALVAMLNISVDAVGYQSVIYSALEQFYKGYLPIKPYVDFFTNPIPGFSKITATPVVLIDILGNLGGYEGLAAAALFKIFQAFGQGVYDSINDSVANSVYGAGTPISARPRAQLGGVSNVGLVVVDPAGQWQRIQKTLTDLKKDVPAAFKSISTAISSALADKEDPQNRTATPPDANATPTEAEQEAAKTNLVNAEESNVTPSRAQQALSAIKSAGTTIGGGLSSIGSSIKAKVYDNITNKEDGLAKGRTSPVIGVSGGAFEYDLLFPNNVVKLLLGQQADILFVEAPQLQFGIAFQKFFPLPIFPPLGLTLNAQVNIFANFNFGWDTQGFYFSTVDIHGNPQPAFGFLLRFAVGVELNLYLISAGLQAFLQLEVDFNWNTSAGATRLHQSQIDYLETQVPVDLFQVHITITIGITIYVDLNLLLTSIRLVNITFQYSFGFDIPIARPTAQLGYYDSATHILYLNMGYQNANFNANARLFGDLTPINEDFTLVSQGGSETGGETIEVEAQIGTAEYDTETFSGVLLVKGWAGHGATEIDASSLKYAVVNLYGGDGNSVLLGGAAVANTVSMTYGAAGSNGRNYLYGGTGTSTLTGGTGENDLVGGTLNSIIYDTSIYSGDDIYAGTGSDLLYGALDGDTFHFSEGFQRDRLYVQGIDNTVDMSGVTSSIDFNLGKIVDSASAGSSYIFLTPTDQNRVSTWIGGSGGDNVDVTYFPTGGASAPLTFDSGAGVNDYYILLGNSLAVLNPNAALNTGYLVVNDHNAAGNSTMLVRTTRPEPLGGFSDTAVSNGREQMTMTGLHYVSLDAGDNIVLLGSTTQAWTDLGTGTLTAGKFILIGDVEVDNTVINSTSTFEIDHRINVRDNGSLTINLTGQSSSDVSDLIIGNLSSSAAAPTTAANNNNTEAGIYSSSTSQIYGLSTTGIIGYSTITLNFLFFIEVFSFPIYATTVTIPPIGDGSGTITINLSSGALLNEDSTHKGIIEADNGTLNFNVRDNVGQPGNLIDVQVENIAGQTTGTNGNVYLYGLQALNVLQGADVNALNGITTFNGAIDIEMAPNTALNIGWLSAGGGKDITLVSDQMTFATSYKSYFSGYVPETATINLTDLFSPFFGVSAAQQLAIELAPPTGIITFNYQVFVSTVTTVNGPTINSTGNIYVENATDRENIQVGSLPPVNGQPAAAPANTLYLTSADMAAFATAGTLFIGRQASAVSGTTGLTTSPITGAVTVEDYDSANVASLYIRGSLISLVSSNADTGLRVSGTLQFDAYVDPNNIFFNNGSITTDNTFDLIAAPTVQFNADNNITIYRPVASLNLNDTPAAFGGIIAMAGLNATTQTGTLAINSTMSATGTQGLIDLEAGALGGSLYYTPLGLDAAGGVTLYALGGSLNLGSTLIEGLSLDAKALDTFTLRTEVSELINAVVSATTASGSTLTIQNTGDLQIDNVYDHADNISITTTGGGLLVNDIDAGTHNLTLSAVSGSVLSVDVPTESYNILASSLNLTAGNSGSGSTAPSILLATEVSMITALADVAGYINLSAISVPVTLEDVETTNGAITVSATGANQSITVQTVISDTSSANNTVTLTAGNAEAGDITVGTATTYGTLYAGLAGEVDLTAEGRLLMGAAGGMVTAKILKGQVYGTANAAGYLIDLNTHASFITALTQPGPGLAGLGAFSFTDVGSPELVDVETAISGGNVIVSAAGTITADIVKAPNESVFLTAGTSGTGSILMGSSSQDIIVAQNLKALAPDVITLATTVGDLVAESTVQGDVTVTESDGISYDYVYALDGNINLTSGSINGLGQLIRGGDSSFGVIDAVAGNVTLTAYGTALMMPSSSILSLAGLTNPVSKITGDLLTVTSLDGSNLTTNVQTINATTLGAGNIVFTQDGAVTLNNVQTNPLKALPNLAMPGSGVGNANGGDVMVTAGGTISVDTVAADGLTSYVDLIATAGDIVTSATASIYSATNVTLTSQQGSIRSLQSSLSTAVGQIVASLLIAQAKSGIVAYTDVDHLQAQVTAAGNLAVYQKSAFTIDSATTANGSIYIEAGDNITVTTVRSLTDSAADSISIIADTNSVIVSNVLEGTGTSASYGNINIEAIQGTIQQVSSDSIIGNQLTLLAAGDIGRYSVDGSLSLMTTVNTVTADSTATGGIYLDQTQNGTFTHVLTADGQIIIRDTGTLTAISIVSGTSSSLNPIQLITGPANTDDILVGSATATGAINAGLSGEVDLTAQGHILTGALGGLVTANILVAEAYGSTTVGQPYLIDLTTRVNQITAGTAAGAGGLGTGDFRFSETGSTELVNVQTVSGNITVSAVDSITVDLLKAPLKTVFLTAGTGGSGSIVMGTDPADIIVAQDLKAIAPNDISIHTTVNDLIAESTLLGSITNTQTTDVNYDYVYAKQGTINLTTGSIDMLGNITQGNAYYGVVRDDDGNITLLNYGTALMMPATSILALAGLTSPVSNISGDNLQVTAYGDIGHYSADGSSALMTTVNSVTADSMIAGGIYIDQSQDATFTHVLTTDGQIIIRDTGTLTAISIVSGTSSALNPIQLITGPANTDDILVGSATAAGAINAGLLGEVDLTAQGHILTGALGGLVTANILVAEAYGSTTVGQPYLIDLTTRVNFITAGTAAGAAGLGTGDFRFSETGSTELVNVQTVSGNITVTAANSITVDLLKAPLKTVLLTAGTGGSGSIVMGANLADIIVAQDLKAIAANDITINTTVNDLIAESTTLGSITNTQTTDVNYDYVYAKQGTISLTTGSIDLLGNITQGNAYYGVVRDDDGNITLLNYGTALMMPPASILALAGLTSPVPNIFGNNLQVTAYGDIGHYSADGSSSLMTTVNSVTADAKVAGGIYIDQSQDATFTHVLTTDGQIIIRDSGTLTAVSIVSGTSSSLNPIQLITGPANTDDILVGSATTAGAINAGLSGEVDLTAQGHILTGALGGLVTANILVAEAYGSTTVGQPYLIDLTTRVNQITAGTAAGAGGLGTGDFRFSETGSTELVNVQTVSGNITVSAVDSITVDLLKAPLKTVFLTAGTGGSGSIVMGTDPADIIVAQDLKAIAPNDISIHTTVNDLIAESTLLGSITNTQTTDVNYDYVYAKQGTINLTTGSIDMLGNITQGNAYYGVVRDDDGNITLLNYGTALMMPATSILALAGLTSPVSKISGDILNVTAYGDITLDTNVQQIDAQTATVGNITFVQDSAVLLDSVVTNGSLALPSYTDQTATPGNNVGGYIMITAGGTATVNLVAANGIASYVNLLTTAGDILLNQNGIIYAPTNVTLTSQAGHITTQVNSLSTAVGQIIADTLIAEAYSGILAYTDINTLRAMVDNVDSNTGSGDLTIYQTKALTVNYATTANGAIYLKTPQTITANLVQSFTDATHNTITLISDHGDLFIDGVLEGTLTSASYGNVILDAAEGTIQHFGSNQPWNVVGNDLTLLAQEDIGTYTTNGSGALDISVNMVTADSTDSGGIYLNQLHDVNLAHVLAHNGPIDITAGGTITATMVETTLDSAANSIFLGTTNGGDILTALVVAGAQDYIVAPPTLTPPLRGNIDLESAGAINGLTPLPNNVNIAANSLILNATTGIGNVEVPLISVRNISLSTVTGGISFGNISTSSLTVNSIAVGSGNIDISQHGGGDMTVIRSVDSDGDVRFNVGTGAALYVVNSYDNGSMTTIADKIEFIGGTGTIFGTGSLTIGPDNPQVVVSVQSPLESLPPDHLPQLEIGQMDLHAIAFNNVFFESPLSLSNVGVTYIWNPQDSFALMDAESTFLKGGNPARLSLLDLDLPGAPEVQFGDQSASSSAKEMIVVDAGMDDYAFGFGPGDSDFGNDPYSDLPTVHPSSHAQHPQVPAGPHHATVPRHVPGALGMDHATQPKWSDHVNVASVLMFPVWLSLGCVIKASRWLRRDKGTQ